MNNSITKQILKITNEELDTFTFPEYFNEVLSDYDKQFFFKPSGEEYYRLLAKISTLFDEERLLDIGTHNGGSALALAYNPENLIYSYDIEESNEIKLVKEKFINGNINFIIGNVLESTQIQTCPFIFIDITHNGEDEKKIVEYLKEIHWHGITIWDDIYLNVGMRRFWENIKQQFECYDISDLGHWTGSGIVIFK